MIFETGELSPMFEAEGSENDIIHTLLINHQDQARYVSMAIRSGLYLAGIMLLNEDLDVLAYEYWYKLSSGSHFTWTPL